MPRDDNGCCCVWPWLIGFSSLTLSCFTLSSLVILPHETGRLVQPIVQGSSLFIVTGQEICDQEQSIIQWLNHFYLFLVERKCVVAP